MSIPLPPLPEPITWDKRYTPEQLRAHAAAVSAADTAALQERVKVLEDTLRDVLNRMDRARDILTDGKPRPECNWGMLTTEAARAVLSAAPASPADMAHYDAIAANYRAAPAVPLTDEQILHTVDAYIGGPTPDYPLDNSDWIGFARAIEQAHGIGGGGK